MRKTEFIEFHAEMCEKMKIICKDKNADYTGDTQSAFANLQMCEAMNVAQTEQGIMVRMTDKFSRINSFRQKGILKVKDESIEDTCLDLANYAILLLGYLKSKKAGRLVHKISEPNPSDGIQ